MAPNRRKLLRAWWEGRPAILAVGLAMVEQKPLIAVPTTSHPSLRVAVAEHFQLAAETDDIEVRGLVVPASEGASDELLALYPNLEIVSVYGVGLDKVNREILKRRKIELAHTSGVLDSTVAEHALALLLAATRRVREADDFVRGGEWVQGSFPLGRGLAGKRCGIVGLGRIGKEVARLGEAFGMRISYFGRRRQADVAHNFFESLWDLAHQSDILILTLPGSAETRAIVNSEILCELGPEGILVNVSRGSVVDQAALVEALEYGDLGAAALDVFEDEPHVPAELIALPNVVLTPHLGSATEECRQSMRDLVIENLRCYFAGREVPGRA